MGGVNTTLRNAAGSIIAAVGCRTVTVTRTYRNIYGGLTTEHIGTYPNCTESECDMTGEILVKDSSGRTVAWYTHIMGWTLPHTADTINIVFAE